MRQISDEELMNRVLAKERQALEELYDRYVKLVYSFALKSTRREDAAKDIVQQVFTRLWTTKRGYDSTKGLFVNWLITITRNITVDYCRRERKQPPVVMLDEAAWAGLPSTESDPAELALQRLQREQVAEAYRTLSDSQIQLIEHVYWQGYTLSEVAEMKNEPLGTIKSRLHQSLKLLRRMFAAKEG